MLGVKTLLLVAKKDNTELSPPLIGFLQIPIITGGIHNISKFK